MTAGDQTQTSAGAGFAAPALIAGDPRQVGGIRLLGRLGEGGMGTVYLGRTGDGRLVAVKVIRADYARDERFRARFRAEARSAQRVARFCTAQVLDAGIDDAVAYLVTEYIDGPTLTAAVDRDGPLHASMLDSLAIGVAAALHGIHAAGVVHRDLKPGNVLLSRVGPKVIDFGIARATDTLESLTDSGHIVGTPAYMAPEQFDGQATAASDVFSFGAVIAYAGTGRAPFGTGSAFELMRRVTQDEPDLDGVERPLRDLLAKALDKRPQRRPTAKALLLALVGDRQDPVGASTRILSSAWPATLVDVPPTTVDVAPTKIDSHPTADGAREPAAKRRKPWITLAAAAVAVAIAGAAVMKNLQDPEKTDPSNTPSVTTIVSEEPRQQSTQQSTAAQIGVGSRVPLNGLKVLKAGQVDAYRFSLTTARPVYVKGLECSNLVRWELSTAGGVPVQNGEMACTTQGPFSLAAGEYRLEVGGPTDGKYAFQLIGG